MTKVHVKVASDHLERLANRRSSLAAVAELIWNALDGDASTVEVRIDENNLGGFDSIRVEDDGSGIAHDRAMTTFESLGASWKKGRTSPGGRRLHGQAGEGRFSAFAVGGRVKWATKYKDGSKLRVYEILGSVEDLGTFEISDPVEAKGKRTGTEVQITNIQKAPRALLAEDAVLRLAEIFALYLRQYPAVRLFLDGHRVDPAELEQNVADFKIEEVTDKDGRIRDASLTVIEWKRPMDRELVLCDGSGFALGTTPAGIHAKGHNFTAYLKCDLIRELADDHALDLDELHPELRVLMEKARSIMRDFFRERTASRAREVVNEWKEAKVYPYEGAPKDPVEEVERQVFDVLALNVNEYLPEFSESDAQSKRFSFQMLRNAIEQSPNQVRKIIADVLDLPKEKQEELATLLEQTSLTAIINASRTVVSRLDFIAGLETLLFESESKKRLKERKELHRLLADNPWVFGEEFNLSVDDQGLGEVLKKHEGLLDRESDSSDPVRTLDGGVAIVDLMLSKLIRTPRPNEFEHLVVELKRPSKKIDAEVLTQVEKYAFAVANDERFRDANVRWEFWAVSSEMDEHARRRVSQRDRPEGLLHVSDDARVRIWAKTWSQIIPECKGRLRFFQERLNYMATSEGGMKHLKEVYAKYLPNESKSK